jgi:hypothetical protein
MPNRQSSPENPFDDSNQSAHAPVVNGHSGTGASMPQGPLQANPYGYKPMPSYLGRQESSANHMTMHAAEMEGRGREGEGDVSPEEVRRPVQYRF